MCPDCKGKNIGQKLIIGKIFSKGTRWYIRSCKDCKASWVYKKIKFIMGQAKVIYITMTEITPADVERWIKKAELLFDKYEKNTGVNDVKAEQYYTEYMNIRDDIVNYQMRYSESLRWKPPV
jgi:hypothetical protein